MVFNILHNFSIAGVCLCVCYVVLLVLKQVSTWAVHCGRWDLRCGSIKVFFFCHFFFLLLPPSLYRFVTYIFFRFVSKSSWSVVLTSITAVLGFYEHHMCVCIEFSDMNIWHDIGGWVKPQKKRIRFDAEGFAFECKKVTFLLPVCCTLNPI